VTADVTAATAAPTTADEDNLGMTVEKKLTSEVTETVTVTGTYVHQLARSTELSFSLTET